MWACSKRQELTACVRHGRLLLVPVSEAGQCVFVVDVRRWNEGDVPRRRDFGIQRRADLSVLTLGRFASRLVTLDSPQPAARACPTVDVINVTGKCLKTWKTRFRRLNKNVTPYCT